MAGYAPDNKRSLFDRKRSKVKDTAELINVKGYTMCDYMLSVLKLKRNFFRETIVHKYCWIPDIWTGDVDTSLLCWNQAEHVLHEG